MYVEYEESFEVFAYFLSNGRGPKIPMEKSSSKARGLAIVRSIKNGLRYGKGPESFE